MSHLEDKLLVLIQQANLPAPEQEVRLVDGRRYRWDMVWRDKSLACEIQGAVWVKGGHSTGTGINRDAEKNNLATLAGWKVLYFTGDMIKDGRAVEWLKVALD